MLQGIYLDSPKGASVGRQANIEQPSKALQPCLASSISPQAARWTVAGTVGCCWLPLHRLRKKRNALHLSNRNTSLACLRLPANVVQLAVVLPGFEPRRLI